MNFSEIARLLDHDEDLLVQGEEVCTNRLLDPDEIMRVVSRASAEQRAIRKLTYFHPAIAARQRLGQGFHDRAEAYLFAAGEVDERDRTFIMKMMPMPARIVSVAAKTLRAGETWDVSVRAQHWGMSDKQDCFSIVNVGTLRMEQGARVVVHGNILSLVCQTVISDGGVIEIQPTPYSSDDGSGPHHGIDGADGRDGKSGADGMALEVESSILGPVLREGFAQADLNGQHGSDGGAGGAGGHGRNGGMCKLAEITLRRIEGDLTVFAQAGNGGNGGAGGKGGAGGAGGNGKPGRSTVGADVRGGRGGDGGNGGEAGRGGNAGHGGLSSNIYINLPVEDCARLSWIALAANGGKAGAAGGGGAGGLAGAGGSSAEVAQWLHGEGGRSGSKGKDSKPGVDGRSRPAACIFINEEMQPANGRYVTQEMAGKGVSEEKIVEGEKHGAEAGLLSTR